MEIEQQANVVGDFIEEDIRSTAGFISDKQKRQQRDRADLLFRSGFRAEIISKWQKSQIIAKESNK